MNKTTQEITKKAFAISCKKYKCEKEDIKDCTVNHVNARTMFIKFCHSNGMGFLEIGKSLGERTSECIESYYNGSYNAVKPPREQKLTPISTRLLKGR